MMPIAGKGPGNASRIVDTPVGTVTAASATAAHQGHHTHQAPAASTAGSVTRHKAELARPAHRLRTEAGMQVRRGGTTAGLAAADNPRAQHIADTAADRTVGTAKAVTAAGS